MRRSVAKSVKSLFRWAGYELRRRPNGYVWGVDPYADQKSLMGPQGAATIVDVGANEGQTAALYRALFPASRIHCFEPFPPAFERLERAARRLDRVDAHRLAVAEAPGHRTLFSNQSDLTNSLLPVSAAAGRYVGTELTAPRGEVEIEATTLDAFCARGGIERVDILKMDIQGAELLALRGAHRLLSAGSIGLIYSEVSFAPLYDGQAYFDQLARPLREYGYSVFGLYNLVHTGRAGLAWADAIFVCPALTGEHDGR